MRFLANVVPGVLVAASVSLAGSAHADEPAPIVTSGYTCHVGEHEGFDDADARTSTDLFCGELVAHRAPRGEYDVRFGKLGSRVLFSARERTSGEERRVLIQSIEEVPLAAGRLVEALAEKKTVAETQSVDNVVSSESRKPKTKSGSVGVHLGLVGMTALATAPSASAGFDLGVGFRTGRAMLGGTFRAGGLGSGSHKLGFVGLDFGARYYLGDGDVAPFFGGGVGISYLSANGEEPSWANDDKSPNGSGFGANLEGGIEIFRSSSAAASLSLRADLPFYALKGSWNNGPSYGAYSYGANYSPPPSSSRELYAVPLSLNVGFTFR
ncbi:hypothetical protein BH11MYX4_BH11MYX4_67800 [soil metagenome]